MSTKETFFTKKTSPGIKEDDEMKCMGSITENIKPNKYFSFLFMVQVFNLFKAFFDLLVH